MKLEGLFQGKNSVLYGSESKSVLYEKLSNTIHAGKRERLGGLQKRIERKKEANAAAPDPNDSQKPPRAK